MSLYTLYCERCDKRNTHEEVWDHESHPLSIEHPRYDDLEVLCRDCNAGRSKADIPEDGLDATATVKMKVRDVPVHIDPNEIKDDESIYEHVERLVREEHMGTLVKHLGVRPRGFSIIPTDYLTLFPGLNTPRLSYPEPSKYLAALGVSLV